jgi:general secretion pathway protein G
VNTTRRTDDPTIVFLPDQRELIQNRSRRRKRFLAIGAIALVIITAGSIAFDTINSRRLASERKLMREHMARRELNLLADGLERFRADLGRYPNDDEGIAALTRKTATSKFSDSGGPNYWTGPYVDGVYEVDPWGNDYVYRLTDGGQRFELFSYGPEGEGGPGPRLQVTSSTSFVN